MSLFRHMFTFAALTISSLASFAGADETSAENQTPIITESFAYKNSYYLTLSDGSRYSLKAVLLEKGNWFCPDKYGNPAAHWVINDRVVLHRAEGFEFPFKLVNLENQEEALAAYYNPHIEGIENVHTMFQLVMDAIQKQNIDFIKNELHDIKHSLANLESNSAAIQQLTSTIQNQNTELNSLRIELGSIRNELTDIKNSINALNNQGTTTTTPGTTTTSGTGGTTTTSGSTTTTTTTSEPTGTTTTPGTTTTTTTEPTSTTPSGTVATPSTTTAAGAAVAP